MRAQRLQRCAVAGPQTLPEYFWRPSHSAIPNDVARILRRNPLLVSVNDVPRSDVGEVALGQFVVGVVVENAHRRRGRSASPTRQAPDVDNVCSEHTSPTCRTSWRIGAQDAPGCRAGGSGGQGASPRALGWCSPARTFLAPLTFRSPEQFTQPMHPTQSVQRTHPTHATQRVQATHATHATHSRTATHNAVTALAITPTLPAVPTEPATATLPAVATEPATATLPAVDADPATATLPAVATDPATAALSTLAIEPTTVSPSTATAESRWTAMSLIISATRSIRVDLVSR